MTTLSNTGQNSASDIRRLMRSRRRALSTSEQNLHARALAKTLSRFNLFRYSKRLALYLANDGEIDTSLTINLAWNMGKQIYLPVLSPLKNQLYFARYQPDCTMKKNRFGIMEPDIHPKKWLTAQQIDTLFLPLVAFDKQGNRLGMGGGFYDRSLAYLSNRTHFRKPKLIGLAHDIQQHAGIDHQKWDIPLDTVITEKQIIHTK